MLRWGDCSADRFGYYPLEPPSKNHLKDPVGELDVLKVKVLIPRDVNWGAGCQALFHQSR